MSERQFVALLVCAVLVLFAFSVNPEFKYMTALAVFVVFPIVFSDRGGIR